MRCFKFSASNQYKMCTLRLCWSSCFLQSFPKAISGHSIHLLQMTALFDFFSVCIALCFLTEAVAEQKAAIFLPCFGYRRTHPTGWNTSLTKRPDALDLQQTEFLGVLVPSHAGKSHRSPGSSLLNLLKNKQQNPHIGKPSKSPVFC